MAPSSSAIIQRMGRPNGNAPLPSSSQASQLIRFGKARPRSSAPRIDGNTSADARPGVFFTNERYTSSGTAGSLAETSSASGVAPTFFANPFAAFVHAPSPPFATLSEGPQTRSSRSACRPPPAPPPRAAAA